MTECDRNVEARQLMRAALASVTLAMLAAGPVVAQSVPMVYPSQGQSSQRQARDEGDCRNWAQQQTGFNPSQSPIYYGSDPQPEGQVVGGAARGALLGLVGGAIGGDAGKGAAIGAGVGATAGLMRRGQTRRGQQQANQRSVDDHNQRVAAYNRAFATCMQGRGYAVN